MFRVENKNQQVDKQIDQMVYELYGLSEEEIDTGQTFKVSKTLKVSWRSFNFSCLKPWRSLKNKPMETGTFYHYFNRGNNRENLFKEEANYNYFLQLLKKHITPVVDVYSYCLLPNHFHLVIKTKELEQLPQAYREGRSWLGK